MMLKQQPLFSCFYIVATGLAISMVMVLAVLYYIKIGDIYPETSYSQYELVGIFSSYAIYKRYGLEYYLEIFHPFCKGLLLLFGGSGSCDCRERCR